MKIDFILTDIKHPFIPYLIDWMDQNKSKYQLELYNNKEMLMGGDLLFLISCHELISSEIRGKYTQTLVLHASDLPLGRGWSPHIWDILEGSNEITISLIEADDKVDTGKIWSQKNILLYGHELYDEINKLLFSAELELIDYAIINLNNIFPLSQEETKATYRRRRNPDDSCLNKDLSLASQFNLLRVCDPHRFPAYFDHLGNRYYVTIRKQSEHE